MMSVSNAALSQDEAAGVLQRYGRGYMGRNEANQKKSTDNTAAATLIQDAAHDKLDAL